MEEKFRVQAYLGDHSPTGWAQSLQGQKEQERTPWSKHLPSYPSHLTSLRFRILCFFTTTEESTAAKLGGQGEIYGKRYREEQPISPWREREVMNMDRNELKPAVAGSVWWLPICWCDCSITGFSHKNNIYFSSRIDSESHDKKNMSSSPTVSHDYMDCFRWLQCFISAMFIDVASLILKYDANKDDV